mmetsp:Transcript_16749/g.23044  ORF Transcript_16749/g.23044 Transcript_16749/m.23044 type:complete len:357 (+) Transcript_16749:624-1694(+)
MPPTSESPTSHRHAVAADQTPPHTHTPAARRSRLLLGLPVDGVQAHAHVEVLRLGHVVRQPQVHCSPHNIVCLGAPLDSAGLLPQELPVPERARIVVQEAAHGDLVVAAQLQEPAQLRLRQAVQLDLQRVQAGPRVRLEPAELHLRLVQSPVDDLIVLIVQHGAFLHLHQLRLDHRRLQVGHAEVEVGQRAQVGVHHVPVGLQVVVLEDVGLVAAGQKGGLDHDLRVVGGQDAAFAGVHNLVGLEAEGRALTDLAQLLALPLHAQSVRAVLQDLQVILLDDGLQTVHVGHVAAHVGHEKEAGARLLDLLLQVVQVQGVVVVDLAKHHLSLGPHHGAWHSDEGEGRHQNLVSWLQAH